MKILTRTVFDMTQDGIPVIEEDSYEYDGPVALCKDSGSAPQPVDPYTQAAAQYGVSTGTADYNARLNRTNQQNALGSTGWNITGYDNPTSTGPSQTPGPALNPQVNFNGSGAYPPGLFPGITSTPAGGVPSAGQPTGAPIYTQTTNLAPQFQSQLEKPIDTTGIAGMPGGPSTTQDLQNTQDALYQRQMAFLKPEQDLQSEQMTSNLANQGATIGSPAWNNEQDRLAREQTLATQSARDSAITGAGAEQSRLFGMGSQSLQDQIAARNAPISEFQALLGPQAGAASALTPDISGAFGQQYQGQLAGYNADTASNNETTSTVSSLALAAALYF